MSPLDQRVQLVVDYQRSLATADALLQLRQSHPTWGPKKLFAMARALSGPAAPGAQHAGRSAGPVRLGRFDGRRKRLDETS